MVSLLIRFFRWAAFRKDLQYIKKDKVHQLVDTKQAPKAVNQYDLELLDFKKEIDILMKDVCFDVYDRNKGQGNPMSETDFTFDFEESLEKLLDGKILDIVKENELLLVQKDSIIASLEDKNRKILKDIVNKMFFLIVEKDKLLKQKDGMIDYLKSKMAEIRVGDVANQQEVLTEEESAITSSPQKKTQTVHADFVNVNS